MHKEILGWETLSSQEKKYKISVFMDSIKKKMQSLAQETAKGKARAEKWEKKVNTINEKADQSEEQVKTLQKKIQFEEPV